MREGKREILPTKRLNAYQLTPNEAISTGSINRVLEHLLKNDDLLREKLDEDGLNHAIVSWSRSAAYDPGDLVCYIGYPKPEVPAAYILLCIAPTHTEPTAVLKNNLKALEDSGWRLVHPNTVYLIDPDLLKSEILTPAAHAVIDLHVKSKDGHDSTVISSLDDFSKLFLKNDLSNYVSPRILRSDGTDSGAIAESSRFNTIHDEGTSSYSARVSDNVQELEITFSFDSKVNQDIEILNNRYYLDDNPVRDKSDAHIFGSYYGEDLKNLTLSNGLTYYNVRVPGSNIFSTTITFDKPFKDSTYMIFQSAYLPNQFLFAPSAAELVKRTAGNNAVFVGNLMFMNKRPDSVTVILPIHPHFSQYGQYTVGVPWINSFKINVVGVLQ